MADTNERKRRALDSPLFQLIEETWIDYDSRISSFSISEEDVFRYCLWCIEGLKDNAGNRTRHECKMRALLFQPLKKKYGAICQPKEINLLADIIMAYTIESLEWAQTADWTTFMSVYNDVLSSIAPNDDSVLAFKKVFNDKVFEMDLCASFKEWIVEHLQNDEFLTEEDAEWAEENLSVDNKRIVNPGDLHVFEMTPENWVKRYKSKITHSFKEDQYLIAHIQKLRTLYIEAINDGKINRTGFLRDRIFWPKSPWLRDPNLFAAEAVRDLFSDTKFTDKIVTSAKKKQ